jgi:GntR family transcriptional regulator/MocR family aminotransferase
MTKRSQAQLLALPASLPEAGGLRDGIYRACVAAIRDGRLAAGRRLPSSRQLASDWQVARNTVDDALAQLQSEGLIVRRVGAGTFVAPDVVARSPAADAAHRALAALGKRALAAASSRGASAARPFVARSVPRPQPFVAGMPALDAFPLDVWRRLAARCWRSNGPALLGYLPASGYPPLQSAIADHLAAARGIRCAAAQVMVLNSAMQALDLIARVLVERDDVGWVEDPCYPNLRAVLTMAGVRIASVPVDAEGMAVQRMARNARTPALICVTPSCQYPTGTVMSLARRLALLRVAEQSGSWIVEDDHQAEFTWVGRAAAPVFALDRGARTLYVGTFSHTVFPSLRLAYVVLPPSLVDVFHAVRRQLDDHTHGFLQAVLADFMAGGHYAAHLRRMRTLYSGRRQALIDAFARLAPHHALGGLASGMHATLELPARVDDRTAAARAARAGIRVLPLSRYVNGPAAGNGLLLGYSALPERRIAAAVARLARALTAGESGRNRGR